MLDIHYIEKNCTSVIEKLSSKGLKRADQLIRTLIDKNKERKELQHANDSILHQLKKRTKQVGFSLAKGDVKGAEEDKKWIKNLKVEAKELAKRLRDVEADYQQLLLELPNLPDDSVPMGKDEAHNVVISRWPNQGELPMHIKPHWELLEEYRLTSFEQGNQIVGAGFPVYHGKGAKLQRALINFFLEEAITSGYDEVQVPLLVNASSAFGTGQIPDKEQTMYGIENTAMYLIPTAEVPVTNIYRGRILEEKELPIRHVAYTPCFRQEAGSWGSDVRGLNRLHQFDKVELVEIHKVEDGQVALEGMLRHVTSLLEKLSLPYRVLQLCRGELGFASAFTYDVEVWSAGQKKWLEVSSVSLFKAFQARRMKLFYKDKAGKHLCYTLNGSGLALPRIMASLLENYQEAESICIPEALHPYTQFEKIRV
ncbi:MAG: serine--tRNA ligase [Bacteroidota bacterium]